MTASTAVLEFVDVAKIYRNRRGTVHALHGMTFRLEPGAIHVLLGPNGAGKSTSLEMAVGLRRPDSGTVRTLGLNPIADAKELHCRVSLQPQEVTVFEYLRVGEILDIWASLYDKPCPSEEILTSLDLADLVDRQVTKLSGGQQQRLNVALAMTSKPELLILDEPSTGLDPRARATLWSTLRNWRDQGTTIVLSTHSMEEAHALADSVMILDRGKCIDHDTPDCLVSRYVGGPAITFTCHTTPPAHALAELDSLGTLSLTADGRGALRSPFTDRALGVLAGCGYASDIRVNQPTLGEAYAAATGSDLSPTLTTGA